MEKLIMGIAPGTNFMGYAIIRTEGRHKKPELVVSGVLDMNKINDPYIKLQRIFKRTLQVITCVCVASMSGCLGLSSSICLMRWLSRLRFSAKTFSPC